MHSAKKWCIVVIAAVLLVSLLLGAAVVVVDPFFHYHKPLELLEYPFPYPLQRYQTDGIVKHFDYDAIITGNSMTECFRASELDELFQVQSVKVPLSGSSYKETMELLRRAKEANPRLKLVVRSLFLDGILQEKDTMKEFDYPVYLYDRNPINDVEYVLNKTVLIERVMGVLKYTAEGNVTSDFDTYSSWAWAEDFGSEYVLERYERPEQQEAVSYTPQTEQLVRENIQQNVISLARDFPDVQFYYFFPPQSLVWWDSAQREGKLESYIRGLETASEMLLEYDNIHLFSFILDRETVENLDIYRDTVHYNGQTNSRILRCMSDGQFQLTRQNNAAYWQEVWEYMTAMDFDAYLESWGYEPE